MQSIGGMSFTTKAACNNAVESGPGKSGTVKSGTVKSDTVKSGTVKSSAGQ